MGGAERPTRSAAPVMKDDVKQLRRADTTKLLLPWQSDPRQTFRYTTKH